MACNYATPGGCFTQMQNECVGASLVCVTLTSSRWVVAILPQLAGLEFVLITFFVRVCFWESLTEGLSKGFVN